MHQRRLQAAMVAGSLVIAALVAGAANASSVGFRVTSTLDGKKVLPRRIAWVISTPGLTRAGLKSGGVSFLIDGKIKGGTEAPPYTFPEKGGYLVTTWLTPGTHVFTSRVFAKDGSHVDDNVTAKTVAPAAPPAALAGTWTRTLSDVSGAPAFGSAGNPTNTPVPAGVWKLTFDARWIQARFPGTFNPKTANKTGKGLIIDNDWTPGAKTFQAWGGVQKKFFQNIDAEGGWWCFAGGPENDYSWSVSGNTLTLTPVGGADRCGVRGFVWAGQWTRAH